MRRFALLLALLIPSASPASTRLLLFDDIGSAQASFAWGKVYGGGVELSADYPACSGEDCYGFHSTGKLHGFRLDARDVYYVGHGAATPVLCGRTRGWFLDGSRFTEACRISVEPERVCEAWYARDDCARAATRYRVYLSIDDGQPASGFHRSRSRSERF